MAAKFAAVLLFVACASAQSLDVVPVNKCKGSAELLEVRISNCGSIPCIFKKGEFTTIEMDFIPSASTDKVTTGAMAQIALLKIPFRGINNTPACDYISEKDTGNKVGCTLEAGKAYTYSFKMEVLKRYPTAPATVQWELDDANGNEIVCFSVRAKIAN